MNDFDHAMSMRPRIVHHITFPTIIRKPKSNSDHLAPPPMPQKYIDKEWYVRQAMNFDGLWKETKRNVKKA